MAVDQNVELIQRLVELWGRGEHSAVGELLHEDVELVTTPEWPYQGGRASGAENVLDFGLLVDFEDGLIRRLAFLSEPADALGTGA